MTKLKCFKLIIAFFCFLFLLIPVFSQIFVCATPPIPDTSGAEHIYVYNFESEQVIYSKGEMSSKIYPASTVKIMSGLVALKYLCNRQDDLITLTQDILEGVEGFTVNFKVGDTVAIRDLLYGLICGGGNDAAIALANICSGSVDAFVEEMNKTAVSLGMSDTHYTNPTGIDSPDMKTTLKDTVIISKKAIENELFVKIASTNSYTYSPENESQPKTIANRNALISNYSAIGYQNKKVKGLNAGMTDNGGYCVSAYATNGQDTYLCVVMGGRETSTGKLMSYAVTNSLLTYFFDNYTYTKIAKKGDRIGELAVDLALPTNGSQAVIADCVLESDVYAFAPKNIDYKRDLTYKTYYHNDTLVAPVYENLIVGGVDIYHNGTYLASAKLITNSYVAESKLLIILENMKYYILSRTTFLFIFILVPSVLAYFYITVWRSKIRKRKAIEKESIQKK